MSTTSAAPGGNDCHPPALVAAESLAAAIASGNDLGVFELCSSLAKAREAIPVGSSPRTYAAVRAAIGIQVAFEKVASTIGELDPVEPICPCCNLRKQLDELIEIALQSGPKGRLADACWEITDYVVGDYNAATTRTVLELARNVFTAAVAELHRPE